VNWGLELVNWGLELVNWAFIFLWCFFVKSSTKI